MIKIYSLNDFDFQKLANTEADPRTRIRLLMMTHLKNGSTPKETAKMLCCDTSTVTRKFARFKKEGVDGLIDKPRSGAPYKLAPEHHDAFKKLIIDTQSNQEGGRLIGEDIRSILKEKFNAVYTLNGTYDLLKALNMVWISSRSRHPKQDDEIQEAYKKNFKKVH